MKIVPFILAAAILFGGTEALANPPVHAGEATHLHRPVRLCAEGELTLNLADGEDDEALLLQVWVHAAGPLWVGGGIGTISNLGNADRDTLFGIVGNVGLMLETKSVDMELRAYLDHEWSPASLTLIRLDWRSSLPQRVSPYLRIVWDYAPRAWSNGRLREDQWDIVPNAGLSARIGGVSAHLPWLTISATLGWRIPATHDDEASGPVGTLILEGHLFQ